MPTDPLRIAMIAMASSTGSGGSDHSIGSLVRPLACAVAERGGVVDLISRADGVPTGPRHDTGVTEVELEVGPRRPVAAEALVGLTDAFGEGVAERARSAGYDVVHAHGWASGLAALPVALELGTPLVQSFHGLAPEHPGSGEPRTRTEMFLANQASAIVTGSASDVPMLIDRLHAPAERIWVIPPGVDLDLFRPERARTADDAVRSLFGISHDRPVIAVVGSLTSADAALSIRALSELHSLRGWAPVQILVGAGGLPDVEALHALAEEIGVGEAIRLCGPLGTDHLADLLSVATVAVLPSGTTAPGPVALQSAASGTPLVGFRGVGRPESVAEGASALLVDSRDPREWARIITELLDDQVALDALSASARHHAEGYSWAAAATALLGVYASLG